MTTPSIFFKTSSKQNIKITSIDATEIHNNMSSAERRSSNADNSEEQTSWSSVDTAPCILSSPVTVVTENKAEMQTHVAPLLENGAKENFAVIGQFEVFSRKHIAQLEVNMFDLIGYHDEKTGLLYGHELSSKLSQYLHSCVVLLL